MRRNTAYLLTFLFLLIAAGSPALAEDGYRLWLRYEQLSDAKKLEQYRQAIRQLVIQAGSPTLQAAKDELSRGLNGLLGQDIPLAQSATQSATLIAGTPTGNTDLNTPEITRQLQNLGDEGYLLQTVNRNRQQRIIIAANTDIGVLYGVFHFLKLIQTGQPIDQLSLSSSPKIQHRVLNHWDNLDRTVERGYSGFSIWDWHKLPDHIDQRYIDYARANASIGINGTVITNVNANALVLTDDYLRKVAALADVFRPYGLKVYLTARFSAPIEIGGMDTADPLNEQVRQWWKDKATEIYSHIPDFGGFLVKADSEGQPGPHNYGRTQAEGANMLADAVAPHNGLVMWRAFVYSEETPDDRHKQAYNEFKPLDGQFRDNVIVQVKNGAIDFQPREPFHPLFGSMPQTPLMMEFQITQEYLGHATHLVYLAPLFKEVLESDTYAKGKGSTVAKVVDGSLDNHSVSAIAGVANIGTDRNWTGHQFGQANWYAYGRLAWNHALSSEEIADEWIRMTFSNKEAVLSELKSMMLASHEAVVNYMTPLGLHHIMAWSHHYGPGPWIADKHRDDWTSVYYHQASREGIGFDRTETGSNAIEQYHEPVQELFGKLENCPEKYLLWFHHVPWEHQMESGNILWDEMAYKYQEGVDMVRRMQQRWASVEEQIDQERFAHVSSFLAIQEKEARWWKDACLLYFQTFSDRPFPEGVEKPTESLEYYISLDPKFVPGIDN